MTQVQTEVFGQVVSAVRAVINVKEEDVKMDTTFKKDLGAESIDMLDISSEIEKLMGKEVDFSEVVAHAKTTSGRAAADLAVADLVDYLTATKH